MISTSSKSLSDRSSTSVSFHALSIDETLRKLDSSPNGLTQAQAKERLTKFGPNTIPRKSTNGPLKILWNQINSPLIWVLIASAFVAIWADPKEGLKNGIVILAVVVLNTLIGFFQEYRAGQAIESLIEMVPEYSQVVRDGQKLHLPSHDLVPGDIVSLAGGDKVPADMRLLSERNLKAEEAALTGESVPSRKKIESVSEESELGDRTNLVFGGTMITSGACTAVVIATGAKTELGRISEMINSSQSLETPLTQALAVIGKWITISILVIAVIMFALGSWRAMNELGLDLITALRQTATFAIALAVGAIPEGLPAIVTIALAIGVRRMARRRAIVRQLPSVETLGSTSVICTDKTGTLTRNEMTVKELWTPISGGFIVEGVGYKPEGSISSAHEGQSQSPLPSDIHELLISGVLCNDAELNNTDHGKTWEITGDPTEGALLTVSEKADLRVKDLRSAWPRIDAIPFESEFQFMATLHRGSDKGDFAILKGAPEVLVDRCEKVDELKRSVPNEVKRLASQGMRVLAFARKKLRDGAMTLDLKDVESGFEFLGLQGMIDPPRPEAIESIAACHRAGITVKMITGDHRETAQAIGREIGLLEPEMTALSGSQIGSLDQEKLKEASGRTNVFARVAPEHKLRLVRSLQESGHIVAMTGDGVNDAPALKQANIGVAMGITGTAVSKESADIVLTDDNFASIAAAVEEGRRVYDNLVKSLAFLLPTNLGLAFLLMYAVLFFPFRLGELLVPVLPAQILWINLFISITLSLPLAFEVKEPDIMSRPPRDAKAPVLSRFIILRTFMTAALMAAGAIGLFLYEFSNAQAEGLTFAAALARSQTMAVTSIVFFQIIYLFNCRSLKDSVRRIGFFSNPSVFYGISILLILHAAFIYVDAMQSLFGTTSLGLKDLGLAAVVGTIIIPAVSFEKWLRRRKSSERSSVRLFPRWSH